MAQASSAQREPSMEEILASIRRIIEDSDLGRKPEDGLDGVRADNDVKPTFATARVEPAAFDPAPSTDRGAPERIVEVDAFRAELRSESAIADAPKSVTLAHVQAQLEAERGAAAPKIEVSSPLGAMPDRKTEHEQTFERRAFQPVSKPASDEPDAAALDDWRLGVPAPELVRAVSESATTTSDLPEDQIADIEDFELDLSDFQSMAASETVEQSASVASDDYFQAPRPSLISDHVGKQVATSFGELSEALAARNRKNLDEMAEDMLRPMLQDWIDNNLPLMVERLVREEIERVARG